MKNTLRKSAGLAALLVLLAGQVSGALAQEQPKIGNGQRFYEKFCAKCHEAGIGPVITGRGFNEAVYVAIARSGLKGMPAFRVSDIDDETLKDLAHFLSNTKPKP